MYTLLFQQTLGTFLIDEAFIGKDQAVAQVGDQGFQVVDVMGPGKKQVEKDRNTGCGHAESQFEAKVVPILAGTVAPISAYKPSVSAPPKETADRNQKGIDSDSLDSALAQGRILAQTRPI